MPYQVYDRHFRQMETFGDRYRPFMGVMPDDIALINHRISDMLNTEVYRMIFAANDEEFESVRQNVIASALDLGYERQFEWILAEREAAQERYNAIMRAIGN